MKDPAFLFYPGDYLRDTQCLTEQAQVAYDRIMCEHIRNICISQTTLNFLTKRLDELERAQIMEILEEVDGGFAIPWVRESIIKRREYSESRRNNRKSKPEKQNGKPTTKHQNTSLSYDEHMENENEIENDKEKENKKVWFEVFWKTYDKKTLKPKAIDQWMKLSEKDMMNALDAVGAYVASKPDKQYRKDAFRWIRDKCWNDEIILPSQKQLPTKFEQAAKADLQSMIRYE